MKNLFLALCSLCFIHSAFACDSNEITFAKNNICAKVDWVIGPSVNQFNTVALSLSDSRFALNVIPWMVMDGGHEHGSRPVVITNISPKDYLIEKLYFMGGMSGQWFLKLQLLNAKKEAVEEVRTLVEFK